MKQGEKEQDPTQHTVRRAEQAECLGVLTNKTRPGPYSETNGQNCPSLEVILHPDRGIAIKMT